MKTVRFALIGAAALVLCGCNNNKTTASTPSNAQPAAASTVASTKPVNHTCPMSGEAIGADSKTMSYNGKTVGFCCESCETKWVKLTDAEKQAKLAAATK